MEVREGYKNTEVGVIPEDWEVKALSEIVKSFQLGGNYANNEMEGNNVLIKMANLGRGNIELNKRYFISPEIIPSDNDRVFYGDVLFNTRNTLDLVGKVAIWRDELPKAFFNSNIMRIIFKEEKISSNFFMNLIFNTRNSIYQLRGIATGTTSVAAIYTRDLIKLLVPVPTKVEQTAIATALSDADALINSLSTLIAKKRNIKQGAMQELLKPNPDSHREGWEVKKLGEIAEIVGGGTPSSFIPHYWNGTINWFTPTEVGKSKYIFESVRKITKEGFVNCSGKMLPVGTILLTTRAGIGDLSILMNEACTNQGFQSLIAKAGHHNEYLYYLLQTLKNVLIQNASGSTFLEISPNKLRQIEVSIPSIDKQTRIATILSDMDTEIQALETKLEKYRKIKLGMMQNLLTGKIRLV